MNKNNIWEEKKSTEALKNYENNPIVDQKDIINETKKKLQKHEWKIIGGKKKWMRTCPQCSTQLLYSHIQSISLASTKQNICRKCKRNQDDVSEKIRIANTGNNHWNYGKKLSDETKQKLREKLSGANNPFYGKKHSEDVINKLKSDPRIRHYGENNGFYGKHHTDEVKKQLSKTTYIHQKGRKKSAEEKLNISTSLKGKKKSKEHKLKISINSKNLVIKRKEELGILKIGYNPSACKYLNKLNEENNWNLIHALNGGAKRVLCYFLDGYDEKRNIVVEYNEKHHYDINGNLKEKDKNRMNDIIKKIGCKFYIYNEKIGVLTLINP